MHISEYNSYCLERLSPLTTLENSYTWTHELAIEKICHTAIQVRLSLWIWADLWFIIVNPSLVVIVHLFIRRIPCWMLLLNLTRYSIRPCLRESRLKLPSVLNVMIPLEIILTHGPWTVVILSLGPRMVILGNHGNVASHGHVAVLVGTDEPILYSDWSPCGLFVSCSPEHLITHSDTSITLGPEGIQSQWGKNT